MIPGRQSKVTEEVVVAAATIQVKTDLVRITGTTQINTILSPLMLGNGGVVVFVVPTGGNVVLGTTGNILVGHTLVDERLYTLVYSAVAGKWYIQGTA